MDIKLKQNEELNVFESTSSTWEVGVLKVQADRNTFLYGVGGYTGNTANSDSLQDVIGSKQDILTFDSSPTSGSLNPVTSDGIYAAVQDANNIFWATYGTTTYADILAAYNDGKVPMMKYSERLFRCMGNISSEFYFVSVKGHNVYWASVSLLSGSWSTDVFATEDMANKVTTLSSSSTNTQYPSAKLLYDQLATKQDTLTFDDNPTSGSTNPVKSGGVYSALAGKQDTLTFDTEPTYGSSNPVTSNGVFEKIERRADLLNGLINERQVIPSVFTSGNLAEFDANGNTIDAGIAAEDVISSITWTKGTGTNSIQQKGTGAEAISEASVAIGAATHSGTKGFRWTSWDKASLTFTLEKALSKAISNNAWLSVVNDSHYDKCCQVDGNVSAGSTTIKVKTSPFDSKVEGDTGYDAYTITVIDDPTIGDIDLGQTAHAEGGNTKALQMFSHAEGYGTEALGQYSHAEGRENKAVYAAHAEGRNTEAMGNYSHTEGQSTKAYGGKSHAEGTQTETYANNSHTEGFRDIIKDGAGAHAEGYGNVIDITENTNVTTTTVTGQSIGAHAEGVSNKVAGIAAHGEGRGNIVNEEAAHVEGKYNIASGRASHAEGFTTRAGSLDAPTEQAVATEGWFAHAEGNSTLAKGSASHAEGAATKALARASHAEGRRSVAAGNYSHAEGMETMAGDNGGALPTGTVTSNTNKGFFAHAEGCNTLAEGNSSHSEGKMTMALGNTSHAEGDKTKASGEHSHSEGYNTKASSITSHAEGQNTTASGVASHAEGITTKASGENSHAEGYSTEASNQSEHAQGQFNLSHTIANSSFGNAGNTIHSIGIGTAPNAKKNAVEVMQNGDTYVLGVGGYSGSTIDSASTLQSVISTIISDVNDSPIKLSTGVKSGVQDVEAATFTDKNINSSTYNTNVTAEASGDYALALGGDAAAIGKRSVAQGHRCIARGETSHAEGHSTVVEYLNETQCGYGSHTEGYGTIVAGVYSHAEGSSTGVGGNNSHTEGSNTLVSTDFSHAEGYGSFVGNYTDAPTPPTSGQGSGGSGDTLADKEGAAAHAEGNYTVASGNYSHAEGWHSKTKGEGSHAEGQSTVAQGVYSHAEGKSTTSTGINSHAEGDNTVALGNFSHAEGSASHANLPYSHTEGDATTANAVYSHAEGWVSVANGAHSHAEGQNTRTHGTASHSEGNNTDAYGSANHAEGIGTQTNANVQGQHAEGHYNVVSNGLLVVGCGTSDSDRKNAGEVMQNGDIYLYGVGGYDGTNPASASTAQDVINSKVSANVSDFQIRVVSSQSQVGSESNILYIVVPQN